MSLSSTQVEAPAANATARLQFLPVTLFATVMGIGGLSLSWRRAAAVWSLPQWPAQTLFWVALAVFALVAVLYIAKWVRHPMAARNELRHPIRMTFAPTVTIALLVLATAGQDLLPTAARAAWWLGAVGHLVLTLVVLSAWFGRHDIVLDHVTPAWLIPVVGNVVTPLAAPEIGSVELAWFSFGVGVVFWLGLLPILLRRVLLHGHALPPKLTPTLAIFAAPPAVIGLSWLPLTAPPPGDPVFRIAFAATVMFTLMLLAQAPMLARVPFGLPWWATTFPLAAAAAIATAAAARLPGAAYDVVAVVLLALATLVVTVVAALTVRAALRHQICVPE
jgi:tellurite resistance protein